MKKPEVDSFVEIADDYFKHLRRALDESVMSTLIVLLILVFFV